MADLTPIKVKIGLKTDEGSLRHAYPDFGSLACVQAAGIDWAVYLDQHGCGWFYDKKCGHSDHDDASPRGTWLGMVLVSDEIAVQAAAAFPDDVQIVNEATLETFYNDRVACHAPSLVYNTELLQALAAKKALGVELTAEETTGLDSSNDTPGITTNKRKTWALLKASMGYSIRADLRK